MVLLAAHEKALNPSSASKQASRQAENEKVFKVSIDNVVCLSI